jgi:tRNA(fMet)-specific endonuclease VapC
VILDTNALSAVAEGDSAIEPLLRRAAEVAIPVIVLGEYRFGIAESRNRTRFEKWLLEYVPHFRILDVTERTTRHYADIRGELKKTGKPIPINDVWIAALCYQHTLPILSRDRHFDVVSGITRLSW